jgi:DNA-binding response OmpR family regulator
MDIRKVRAINDGVAPIFEPDLQDLLDQTKGKLTATSDIEMAVLESDITFIIVLTPSDETGGFSLKYVLETGAKIGEAIRKKKDYHLVVLTSTVMPGATEGELRPVLEAASGKECGVDFGLCYSPEFVALGTVIRDLLNPDFLLIGESDPRAGKMLEDLMKSLEVLRTNTDPSLARTLVIIGSDTGDLVEIGQALKFGIVDYFIKAPIDIEQVIAKIQKHIGISIPEQRPEVSAPSSSSVVPVAPTPVPTATPASTVRDASIKLLIVEDDKFLRDLAVQKLSKEAFQLSAAMDGEQGIAMAEKELPTVILLDILLPGIDGFEVLRRIRANPALEKTSVAMLSNFGQREDIEKALGLGADQFFIKANYTLDEIVEEVKKIAATPRTGK